MTMTCLTSTEQRIYDCLKRHPGEIVPHAIIAREAYGLTQTGSLQALFRTHIANLRRAGVIIETAHGVGYGLSPVIPPHLAWHCACGALFRTRTHAHQISPWEQCEPCRPERYQRAKCELEAWRARNKRRRGVA